MGNQTPAPYTDISYTPQTQGYRVWIIGDSILDNSYWNGVEVNTTSEQLKKILPNVEVKDRSTECLTAFELKNCLLQGNTFRVDQQYVTHRNEIGIPYDPPSGKVNPGPNFGPKDFIFLSVGGNDFALRGVLDPAEIIGLVSDCVRYYKDRGVD